MMVETCFLLRDTYRGQETVISLLRTGRIQLPFRLAEEAAAVEALIERYQSVPMSLADACLVRMAELYAESEVLTIDSDFRIYRKHRDQAIPLIEPENEGQ
ncbi:MAG: type II toxin-antitoxin system VapC family toxin [Microcystaceae cyanobacterium]